MTESAENGASAPEDGDGTARPYTVESERDEAARVDGVHGLVRAEVAYRTATNSSRVHSSPPTQDMSEPAVVPGQVPRRAGIPAESTASSTSVTSMAAGTPPPTKVGMGSDDDRSRPEQAVHWLELAKECECDRSFIVYLCNATSGTEFSFIQPDGTEFKFDGRTPVYEFRHYNDRGEVVMDGGKPKGRRTSPGVAIDKENTLDRLPRKLDGHEGDPFGCVREFTPRPSCCPTTDELGGGNHGGRENDKPSDERESGSRAPQGGATSNIAAAGVSVFPRRRWHDALLSPGDPLPLPPPYPPPGDPLPMPPTHPGPTGDTADTPELKRVARNLCVFGMFGGYVQDTAPNGRRARRAAEHRARRVSGCRLKSPGSFTRFAIPRDMAYIKKRKDFKIAIPQKKREAWLRINTKPIKMKMRYSDEAPQWVLDLSKAILGRDMREDEACFLLTFFVRPYEVCLVRGEIGENVLVPPIDEDAIRQRLAKEAEDFDGREINRPSDHDIRSAAREEVKKCRKRLVEHGAFVIPRDELTVYEVQRDTGFDIALHACFSEKTRNFVAELFSAAAQKVLASMLGSAAPALGNIVMDNFGNKILSRLSSWADDVRFGL
jgi:hypothetical protein